MLRFPWKTDSELGHRQASITLTRQRQSETSKQRVSATPDFPPIWYWQIAHQLSTTNFPATWPYYVVPRSPRPNQNSSFDRRKMHERMEGKGLERSSIGIGASRFSIHFRDSSFAEFRTFPPFFLFLRDDLEAHDSIFFWFVSEFLFHQFNPKRRFSIHSSSSSCSFFLIFF